jgi:uncharacterized protein (DUF1697 family)
MEKLRSHFTAMGFDDVETYIQSGNVVFTASGAADAVESIIERKLQAALGYPVATMVRTGAELTSIAAHRPFGDDDRTAGAKQYVVFLKREPDEAARLAILAFRSEAEDARVEGREVYWLNRGGFMDSALASPALGKILGPESTSRNVTTVRKIVEKYLTPGSER